MAWSEQDGQQTMESVGLLRLCGLHFQVVSYVMRSSKYESEVDQIQF